MKAEKTDIDNQTHMMATGGQRSFFKFYFSDSSLGMNSDTEDLSLILHATAQESVTHIYE
jgi:hypothetical protein